MKRRRLKIFLAIALVIGGIIFQMTTWGVVIEIGHQFRYIFPSDYECGKEDPPPLERKFTPDHYSFEYNTIGGPIIVIINSIYWQSTPCSLLLSKSDPTYLQSHKNYTSFTFEKLDVVYKDGSIVHLIHSEIPIEARTHEICESCEQIMFKNAITKRMDFSIIMSGTLTRKNSTFESFDLRNDYRVETRFRIYPLISSF